MGAGLGATAAAPQTLMQEGLRSAALRSLMGAGQGDITTAPRSLMGAGQGDTTAAPRSLMGADCNSNMVEERLEKDKAAVRKSVQPSRAEKKMVFAKAKTMEVRYNLQRTGQAPTDQRRQHNPDSAAGLLELGLRHCGCFPSLDAPQGRKGRWSRPPPALLQMKCDHCTQKECSKKTKANDQENAAVNVWSPAQENGEKGEFHKLANATVFLSDCLTCDSCVTTEEGVQVSQQNTKDFFRVLNLNKKCDTSQHKVLAVSVCPQSLPYFAAKFSLSVTDASRRLCGFSQKPWGAL
ncbi:hypothetical protein QTO34_002647 [Cnephaeus nilssonii]|uniref:Nuclear prelamin A recognition factor n=1 Tax=Cnephaeus nilssonii TaxID=3371016 RepID=A0AA40LM88_CNENI|nr:hypothetical protein QTO34_002647 [Eptesicus nilssonii]